MFLVGQVPQPSKITGGEQNLPVTISLMSAHGTDSNLTELVEDMARSSYFEKSVNVGKEAFA
ncbi:unnamed protein product [Clonostachys rosea]|uniref:Uncharacterized protein n=1 Tax=Bionectria ochroleuca TaxID=29856 RepID=A0ABY6TQB9_BIOOC|nr:unnamed protein product [Clonostachys rosea]